MCHDDATLVTTRERTFPLVGGALCLRSFDAIQAAGQAAIGTTAMGALQESMTLQVRQGPLHGAAGQLQVLRDPADAGPTGVSYVGAILQVHIDRPGAVRQILVCIDASEVTHGLVSSL